MYEPKIMTMFGTLNDEWPTLCSVCNRTIYQLLNKVALSLRDGNVST